MSQSKDSSACGGAISPVSHCISWPVLVKAARRRCFWYHWVARVPSWMHLRPHKPEITPPLSKLQPVLCVMNEPMGGTT